MARQDTTVSSDEVKPKRGLFGRKKKPGAQPGKIKQIIDVFKMTRRADPQVTLWVLLGFFGPLIVLGLVGWLLNWPVYGILLGVMAGLLTAMIILGRRAERAAYRSVEGQPGAAGGALKMLRRGWTLTEEPVAIEPRSKDMVFRVVGRPGVVLVGDGNPHRTAKLIDKERKRYAKVLPGVPVHVVLAGSGEDQTPLHKVSSTISKLKPQLTREEVDQVNHRLRALGGLRPPVPQGIDPLRARPDRKAQRGR